MTAQANIIRTNHTSHYTILPNAIWESRLSIAAKSALGYILSKPPTWKIRITDLRNKLGIGRDKVYRALNELVAAGYAIMTRLQRGVRWQFFDTPQTNPTPDTTEPKADFRLPENQLTEGQDALERNEIPSLVSKEKTTTATVCESTQPEEKPFVVVSIELPEVISEKDRAACKAILSKVEEPEIQKEALFALAYALTYCQVRSTPAYLVELIKAAKEKRLTKPAVTTPKPQKYWTPPEPTPVDNATYYRDLLRRFGDSVLHVIPEQYRPAKSSAETG